MKIKALSLHNGSREPWASWIAMAWKTIETRTWRTNYRGPLLICASRTPDGRRAGQALCVVDLVDCRPMTPADQGEARCMWEPGRFAWVLANVRPVPPIPVRGRQRLFDVDLPDDLAERIRQQSDGVAIWAWLLAHAAEARLAERRAEKP